VKTAIYIEDGVVQLIITPESEFEKNALRSFEGKEASAKVFSGSFYDCRGGWVRQSRHDPNVYGNTWDSNDRSLILRMETKEGE
jgi:hypothetical protein